MELKFREYFSCDVEYPDPTEVLMESGTLQCYLSSTFLNGWINYVEPISVRLITRYSDKEDGGYEGNLKRVKQWHSESQYHSDLSYFKDDVLILATPGGRRASYQTPPPANEYWFFWFDCDVSDCQIGRFCTEASREQVLADFIQYADHISNRLSVEYCASEEPVPSIEIDPKTLKGWVKF